MILVNESGGLYQQSGVMLRVRPDGTSTLIQTLNAAAEIELDMSRFPFDGHRLEAVFEVLGFDKDEVVLLSFSVFWMDRSSLGDRLSVSFTGILTGVVYQVVMSDHLPRISYFTLVHGFLNLSFLTMCASVVINLVVSKLDQRGKGELGYRIDRYCRWGFPLAYFGLMLVMFWVAMAFY